MGSLIASDRDSQGKKELKIQELEKKTLSSTFFPVQLFLQCFVSQLVQLIDFSLYYGMSFKTSSNQNTTKKGEIRTTEKKSKINLRSVE